MYPWHSLEVHYLLQSPTYLCTCLIATNINANYTRYQKCKTNLCLCKFTEKLIDFELKK